MFGKTAPSGNLKKKMTILSLFFLNCFYFPFYFFFTPNLSSLSSSSPCRSAAGSAMSIPKRPQASAGCMGLQIRAPTGRVGATSSHQAPAILSPAASSTGHLEVQRRELPPSLGRLKLPLRLPVVPALTICCDPS
ncbi:hypothetical protein PVAP13_4NG046011 [Panicum virgatum]|uniref:Uncharacterized protein n=1 Tax=Panicum virgatum TaxID=38727 RepID=A0A8T0TAZ4_PANVG|nr:hypothetical protein PVAP13_4NG046011 [Panicum virgatum]